MLIRDKDSAFNLKNLARSLVFSAVSALKAGHVILEKENVAVDTLLCHGGLFKSGLTALTLFSGVTGVKVGALEHSGEGGAYGMAVLARYLDFSKKYPSLSDYLEKDVFASSEITTE